MARHEGSCHCGGVTFEVDAELEGLATCNCSMCGRSGAIMVFVPDTALTRTKGEELLTDYQFGKKHIHHAFCSVCGSRPYAWGKGEDGSAWAMVNVRCLNDLDVHTLEITKRYDGRSL
ncbi:MAG: GFA family protein [Alphaproteobacteria bacterium]|nr:GFA family protein [Alphaproteobacteria bacterium]